jgi:hypothetical protein
MLAGGEFRLSRELVPAGGDSEVDGDALARPVHGAEPIGGARVTHGVGAKVVVLRRAALAAPVEVKEAGIAERQHGVAVAARRRGAELRHEVVGAMADADDLGLDGIGIEIAQHPAQLARIAHPVAGHRDDEVAWQEPGAGGRAVAIDAKDQRATFAGEPDGGNEGIDGVGEFEPERRVVGERQGDAELVAAGLNGKPVGLAGEVLGEECRFGSLDLCGRQRAGERRTGPRQQRKNQHCAANPGHLHLDRRAEL